MQVRILPGPLCAAARGTAALRRTLTAWAGGAKRGLRFGRRTLSREKLKALEELQKVDLKIRDLSAEAERHPARLRQIESEKTQARSALDTARGRLADNERARRQNEQLLQLEREKVRKWEARLNELKTPRE